MTSNKASHSIHFYEYVLLSASLIALAAMSIDTILPALSLIGTDLHVSDPNHAQYVVGFLFLGMTLGQIVYGPVSDSFGRKAPVYFGLALYFIGCGICLFSQNFTLMLVGRTLQGLGIAAPRVVSMSMTRDLYEGREMARVMSFVMAVFILVPVIAPAIGQGIMLAAGWRIIFAIFMVVTVALAIWIYKRLPETLSLENRRPFSVPAILEGTREVLKNHITMIYTVCAGLVFGALIGYVSSAQQIFEEYFKVGKLFPLYFAISALSIGVASVVNSAIVRRYGMRLIAAKALLTMIIVNGLFLIIALGAPQHISLMVFMGNALITFFAVGLLFGNLNAIAMEPMGHQAGIASAVIGFVSSAISLVLGTLIGQAFDGTPVPMIAGFAALAAASFVLMLWEAKKSNRRIFNYQQVV